MISPHLLFRLKMWESIAHHSRPVRLTAQWFAGKGLPKPALHL
jgi:hypothetical protein